MSEKIKLREDDHALNKCRLRSESGAKRRTFGKLQMIDPLFRIFCLISMWPRFSWTIAILHHPIIRSCSIQKQYFAIVSIKRWKRLKDFGNKRNKRSPVTKYLTNKRVEIKINKAFAGNKKSTSSTFIFVARHYEWKKSGAILGQISRIL